MTVSLSLSAWLSLIMNGISSIQVPQVTDQKTRSIGFAVNCPARRNFCPERLDSATPSSDEMLPGLLSGVNR